MACLVRPFEASWDAFDVSRAGRFGSLTTTLVIISVTSKKRPVAHVAPGGATAPKSESHDFHLQILGSQTRGPVTSLRGSWGIPERRFPESSERVRGEVGGVPGEGSRGAEVSGGSGRPRRVPGNLGRRLGVSCRGVRESWVSGAISVGLAYILTAFCRLGLGYILTPSCRFLGGGSSWAVLGVVAGAVSQGSWGGLRKSWGVFG